MIVEAAMYFRCALEPPGSRTHGWSWTVFIPWFRYLKCGRWVALALTWWVEVVRDASSPFIAHLTRDNSGGVPGRGCRAGVPRGDLWCGDTLECDGRHPRARLPIMEAGEAHAPPPRPSH